jgi:hypothetical protein
MRFQIKERRFRKLEITNCDFKLEKHVDKDSEPHARIAETVSAERIERLIFLIRGQRVILGADLAALYGVVTWRLNEQVKRNKVRFPGDFVFQLTAEEDKALTSQFARSNPGRGGRRTLPYAFTEHGAIMAAMVLNSPLAVEMSVQVVRAFVRLREILASNKMLGEKLAELERKVASHDGHIRSLFEAIRQLMRQPAPPGRRIGFEVKSGAHGRPKGRGR